jgi:RHS repeat-associated protein
VRQLTNAAGEITLAKSYAPYGELRSTSGSGVSPFAFTGEQVDESTGLVYLRARYYSSREGRFLSRDAWGGDYNSPLSLNRWMYVEGNPINLLDPSGYLPWHASTNFITIGTIKAEILRPVKNAFAFSSDCYSTFDDPTLAEKLWSEFGIQTNYGLMTDVGRKVVYEAARLTAHKLGEVLGSQGIYFTSYGEAFKKIHGNISIKVLHSIDLGIANYGQPAICKTLGTTITCREEPTITNLLHEFGHAFDTRYQFLVRDLKPSGFGTYKASDHLASTLIAQENPFSAQEVIRDYNSIIGRTNLGFKCSRSPCQENIDPYLHEEFADTYMNWILDQKKEYPDNGFTKNLAGRTRREEIDDLMKQWIPKMIVGYDWWQKNY